jgi:transcriptional regulator with XRE-family HTH domain
MISRIQPRIATKLKDRRYRHRFFRARVQDEIATGIQEMREMRKLRQVDLAHECSMKQSAISRLEKADYAGWNFQTLQRIAQALDARLRVTFEPMEKVIEEYEWREKGYSPIVYTIEVGTATEGTITHVPQLSAATLKLDYTATGSTGSVKGQIPLVHDIRFFEPQVRNLHG